jgi:ElaB/YqjD/DUF883 family membrane-anchored ribosome-binding protein
MIQSTSSANLQEELEALRRELLRTPVMEEVEAAAEGAKDAPKEASGARAEIEKVLCDLQERLGEATDEAEDAIAAHPLASVAAAFLLGVLVTNLLSRGK